MEAPAARGKGTPATIPATEAAGRMQGLLGWCWAPLGPMREANGSIARVEGRFTADGRKDSPRRAGAAPTLLRLHKPYGVLCQFTDPKGRPTLGDYVDVLDVYAAGRLDRDSEGLLLLTDSGALQHWLAHPRSGVEKSYWVLLDQTPSEAALRRLKEGVVLKDGPARAVRAEFCAPPPLAERNPPPRIKSSSDPCWLSVTLDEGRNRLLRRLCAAVGTPVLRLIRYRIGPFDLGDLAPGTWEHAPLPPGFSPAKRQTLRT